MKHIHAICIIAALSIGATTPAMAQQFVELCMSTNVQTLVWTMNRWRCRAQCTRGEFTPNSGNCDIRGVGAREVNVEGGQLWVRDDYGAGEPSILEGYIILDGTPHRIDTLQAALTDPFYNIGIISSGSERFGTHEGAVNIR